MRHIHWPHERRPYTLPPPAIESGSIVHSPDQSYRIRLTSCLCKALKSKSPPSTRLLCLLSVAAGGPVSPLPPGNSTPTRPSPELSIAAHCYGSPGGSSGAYKRPHIVDPHGRISQHLQLQRAEQQRMTSYVSCLRPPGDSLSSDRTGSAVALNSRTRRLRARPPSIYLRHGGKLDIPGLGGTATGRIRQRCRGMKSLTKRTVLHARGSRHQRGQGILLDPGEPASRLRRWRQLF